MNAQALPKASLDRAPSGLPIAELVAELSAILREMEDASPHISFERNHPLSLRRKRLDDALLAREPQTLQELAAKVSACADESFAEGIEALQRDAARIMALGAAFEGPPAALGVIAPDPIAQALGARYVQSCMEVDKSDLVISLDPDDAVYDKYYKLEDEIAALQPTHWAIILKLAVISRHDYTIDVMRDAVKRDAAALMAQTGFQLSGG
jgi:hypothetical protein